MVMIREVTFDCGQCTNEVMWNRRRHPTHSKFILRPYYTKSQLILDGQGPHYTQSYFYVTEQ